MKRIKKIIIFFIALGFLTGVAFFLHQQIYVGGVKLWYSVRGIDEATVEREQQKLLADYQYDKIVKKIPINQAVFPNNEKIAFFSGVALYHSGNFEQGIRFIVANASGKPMELFYLRDIVSAEYEKSNYAVVYDLLFPYDLSLNEKCSLYYGIAAFKRGKILISEKNLRQARYLGSRSNEMYYYLIKAEIKLKKYAEAEKNLLKAIKRYPDEQKMFEVAILLYQKTNSQKLQLILKKQREMNNYQNIKK